MDIDQTNTMNINQFEVDDRIEWGDDPGGDRQVVWADSESVAFLYRNNETGRLHLRREGRRESGMRVVPATRTYNITVTQTHASDLCAVDFSNRIAEYVADALANNWHPDWQFDVDVRDGGTR